jgi:hypothetical protein
LCKFCIGTLEEVSKLLGHESIKTTERSYAKWVKGRQDRLDSLVTGTWKKKNNYAGSYGAKIRHAIMRWRSPSIRASFSWDIREPSLISFSVTFPNAGESRTAMYHSLPLAAFLASEGGSGSLSLGGLAQA